MTLTSWQFSPCNLQQDASSAFKPLNESVSLLSLFLAIAPLDGRWNKSRVVDERSRTQRLELKWLVFSPNPSPLQTVHAIAPEPRRNFLYVCAVQCGQFCQLDSRP
ncbi:MAG: hypothetical protein HC866_06255 [Leptolyngbyaceae cyanobacterium RU_5_1]|nr:hypothetical protein [Leptolyngbyaceae cyanobacterium RU_5_1]